ncbi:MAG: hypothetical protein H7197_00675 [Vitreoscilla sp.]|nr:hypothetical protein [Polaromonas sp.]
MFSDHLQKIEHASGKTLLMVAGGLVIVCQLVAMVLVSQGQVEKAQAREVSQASARAATAWCVESSRGAALNDCDRASPLSSALAGADLEDPKPQGLTLATPNNRY